MIPLCKANTPSYYRLIRTQIPMIVLMTSIRRFELHTLERTCSP